MMNILKISTKAAKKTKEKIENYGENYVSLTQSNVEDAKNIEDFQLKTLQTYIIHLQIKSHIITVRMDK